jgi:hypothetical protein
MNVWKRESWKGIFQEGGRGGYQKGWVQDITDELQMSAGHLAYNRAVFRRVVKGAKFRQGHATE